MEQSNSLGGARIALLIDFDNVILGIDEPGFDIELVVNALRERGTITVSRVYGDWYRHSRHRRRLMEHGVELVEAPAFGPVIKNSADIKIALDGYEIGMTMPHINTFCLVSGDSDFLPLIKKLQGLGKQVLVICGNRFTSDMLRRNCNEFISYENLLAASYGADEDATTLEGAFALLHRAMEALRERGSEIRTSTLKQMMIQLNPVFSEKTFGYNQFRGFLDKAGRENLIKLGPRDRVSGEFYVLLPEEDEADVIENNERAEPAEVVEEIVEARRGGRRRRGDDRNGDRERKSEKTETPAEVQAETETQRPRSRREARLLALREQEELEAQAPTREVAPTTPAAAPLATPLTPATDFSPADADEAREKSISRDELLSRGLRVGKFKFSGKAGSAIKVEDAAPQDEMPKVELTEADIALTPEDAGVIASPETAGIQTPEVASESESEAVSDEAQTPETTEEPKATEKPKRSRSRRRRKTADTSEAETPEADTSEAETPDVQTPEAETAATDETATESAPQAEAASEFASSSEANVTGESEAEPTGEAATAPTESAETAQDEAPAPEEKKPRRRRTSRKKAEAAEAAEAEDKATQAKATESVTDEAPATEAAPAEVAPAAETTPEAAEDKPKPKRTRRRKKTDDSADTKDETMTEKAIQPDGTEQPVSDQALIEASADTPAAKAEEKPKARRRRTSRKQAEEKAEAQADVDENIVTTDETTGEVTQKELAQIPVPTSEDEV